MTFAVRGVTVEFGGVLALHDVTVDVPRGAVTTVVGGDGAGKSTLLRCLVGEIAPRRGVIDRPPKAQVGYMSSSSGTWHDLTVDENVDFVAGAYGDRGRALGDRSRDLLKHAGLAQVGDRLAGQLSGGMRQKLGFVLAILHQPALAVLDEPSTGVDPVSRVELWRMIAQAAARGIAVIMSTTYLDEAERASSVVVLDQGRVVLSGKPDDVIAAMSGRVVRVAHPADAQRAWRRGREFHEWVPPGADRSGEPVTPDLEDAVIVEMLRRG
jgi:ABC-2 type transport system ATP-binding protein